MRRRSLSWQTRLRVGTLAILAVGFLAAIVIYVTASPPPENPLGYDPLDTKKYLHELEVYGGKANVIAAEFRDWFDSLWHGKQLAFTIAVLTLIAVGIFRFFAKRLPLAQQSTGAEENTRRSEGGGRNVLPFDSKGSPLR